MEEFNLKETVGDSKPAVKKDGSKKKIILIILVVIGLIGCYLVGYIIGTNLGKEKKKDKPNEEIKEEVKEEELEEEVPKEEPLTLISKEEAEKLITKYHYENTLSGVQPQYNVGFNESIKFEVAYNNSKDKIKSKNCADYADVKKSYDKYYTLKGEYEERYFCEKKADVISYEDLNNSYKSLFGSDKSITKENNYPYIYSESKDSFVELFPISGNPYSWESVYGVQNVELVDNKLHISVGYIELENVEGPPNGNYSKCDKYVYESDEYYTCVDELENTTYYTAIIDDVGRVSYTANEVFKDNFKKQFKDKYLSKLPTYTYVFDKEDDNYILVDFYYYVDLY